MYDFRVCRETWYLKVLTSAPEKYRQEKGKPLPSSKARLYEMAVEAVFCTVSEEVANLRDLISRVAYLNMQHQRRQFDMGHVREALGSDLKTRYDRIAAKAAWVELSRGSGQIPFVKVMAILQHLSPGHQPNSKHSAGPDPDPDPDADPDPGRR